MIVLGIETSTAVCSVGLANDAGTCAEQSLVETHIHSEKLLTLVRSVCESQKIILSQIDGYAVSIGPGSFTGLRIGLSTMKGLCYALEKPLFAVPTFEAVTAVAVEMCPECSRIIICVDAKQGEYYFSTYEINGGTIRECAPVQIVDLSAERVTLDEHTIIVTDRIQEVKSILGFSGPMKDIHSCCRGDVVAGRAIK